MVEIQGGQYPGFDDGGGKLCRLRFPNPALSFPLERVERRGFQVFWKKDKVTHNGYYMRVDELPAENIPEGRVLADYRFGDNAYHYLDRMVELCKENDVELVLVKAPSLVPYWYDEWEVQMEDYAKEHGLKYYNFLEAQDEIGLDWQTDTYDAGLHLNLSGAEKMSVYFGKLLKEECGLKDRRGEASLAADWAAKKEAYDAEIARQKEKMKK